MNAAGMLHMMTAHPRPAVTLYVGNDNPTCQGRRLNLTGPRMFNGTYGPKSRFTADEAPRVEGWCDSGAFQDPPDRRRNFDRALADQLSWEARAGERWGWPYQHRALVSYDVLIDEKWIGGRKKKERWSVADADRAVRATVDAAAFLASKRGELRPRRLVLACQGVDAIQYAECAAGVLAHSTPDDVFGLGGWCILGREKRWLPTFWAALRKTLPMVAAAGLHRVHIFGVMWRQALGGLVWLADRHKLVVSTDSAKAVSDCNWKGDNATKAGRLCETWEDNVAEWRRRLADLRNSTFYREPPAGRKDRQPRLFEDAA